MMTGNNFVLAIAIILFSLSSCGSGKKAVESAAGRENGKNSAVADTKNAGAADKVNDQSSQNTKKDSLFASLSRSYCFGRCPVYKLKIYDSGYVLYEGIRFVEKEGVYATRLSEDEMRKIKEKAKETGYFQLEDEYDNPHVTDIPSTITYLNFNGKEKRIKNRWQGPDQLKEYERFLDAIVEDKEWKLISKEVKE